MKDGFGVTFLRFVGGIGNAKCWLRNKTYNLNGGMDSHNWTWVMVARILDVPNANTCYTGLGCKENATVPNQNYNNGQLANYNGQPTVGGGGNNAYSNPGPSAKRLFMGTQLQVVGAGLSSGDATNKTNGTGDRRGFIGVNETMAPQRGGSDLRAINVPGFTLNAQGDQTPSESGGGNSGGYFDLYELAGWLGGEMGDWTQAPTRFSARMSEAMANYSIPPIARRVIIGGDSRSAYGSGQSGSGGGVDGTQTAISQELGARGYSWSLPADTSVIPYAFGGQGIGAMQGFSEVAATNYGDTPRMLATSMLLGGGNDYLAFMMDANDLGNNVTGDSGQWPDTNSGGIAAPGSNAQGDDLFNGPGYTATATVTINAGATSGSLTNVSGVIVTGSTVQNTNWGVALNGRPNNGNFNTLSIANTTHNAEAATFKLKSFAGFLNDQLAKGVKVLWGTGTAFGPGSAPPTKDSNAVGRFRYHVLNDALGALSAAPGQTNAGKAAVWDPASISIGGKFPIGWPDYQGGGAYIADNIHLTREGRQLVVTGGDTPTLGFSYNIKKLMGVV